MNGYSKAMLSKLLILLAFHELMDTAVVYRRVCSYCRDKEVYQHGHNYVGFYQKQNTGPLEGYPCANDPGKLMKCATSCVQAQIIQQDTGNTYTYRDCGTYLLQEFGREKINLSYTQYAMILTDLDDAGNTWVFKFCNKEKCLHPSDYDISGGEEQKGKTVVEVKPIEKPCPEKAVSSYVLLIFGIAGVIAGLALIIKVYNKWSEERRIGNRVSARMNVNNEELLFEQANQ
ncbi:hypothetical protein Y032_0016g3137 [Ancylostoma ceylanicum]|uniref:Uncharacterized protein n=1 Tax=Ancylostoma ceylanicum TaxID=53326 RepID=A0A016V8T1_9BILA|nr:hypothetical protein Y032_0016g3137 [Ancylostoma ceylanicum]